MKAIYKFASLVIILCVVSLCALAQHPPVVAKPLNLVRGVVGTVSANSNWSGFSAVNLIPGAGIIPVANPANTTVFYLGFTAGSTADISNMVLYTMPKNGFTVSAVTPVKRSGVSNPSINLTDPLVCSVAPSTANPCIVRLDPLTLPLSAQSDYYLAVYFTIDGNNSSIGATFPHFLQSSLNGWFVNGDESRLTVGQTLTNRNTGNVPFFLMAVMTN